MEPALQNSAIRDALGGQVAIFAGLPETGLEQAIGLARREKREKGQILFHQGEPADTFHLVLAGRIRVGQIAPEGQQVIIRYLGPREIAGCVAVCGGLPYPATATAVEDSWLLTWTRPRLAAIAEDVPEKAT